MSWVVGLVVLLGAVYLLLKWMAGRGNGGEGG